MIDIRYPEITVQLTGTDGNAFAIIGKVRRALGEAGIDLGIIDAFTEQATSGDYDDLLVTAMRWVNVN